MTPTSPALYDLTGDLDMIYGHLQAFAADGGGDTPESVNQALNEAVNSMTWSTDRQALKIIFLVGDAPSHMNYSQDAKYPNTCERTVARDVIINTIQYGDFGQTTPIWQEIARRAEGSFVRIAQAGNVVTIKTPVDEQFARLNRQLAATVVPYGSARVQDEVATKVVRATSTAAPAAADRMAYLDRAGGTAVTGAGDLTADLDQGRMDAEFLRGLDPRELPDQLKKLDPGERWPTCKSSQSVAVHCRLRSSKCSAIASPTSIPNERN